MASWDQTSVRSIFLGGHISGSIAEFFVFILKFIFALIFEIEIFEKKIPR